MTALAPIVAIDGPSGSGKGTIAGLLAQKLGWNLLDSGALYRLLAFAARNHGVDLTNEEAMKVLAAHLVPVPRRWHRCPRCARPCSSVSGHFRKCPGWLPMVAIWALWCFLTHR